MRTMLLLHRTSEALRSTGSVREVVELILRELLEHLTVDRALLYINIRDKYLHLYRVEQREPPDAENDEMAVDIPLRMDAGLIRRAALGRRAFNIQDPSDSDLINRHLASKISMNPFALASLVLREQLVGVLGIDRSQSGPISADEFRILQMFANQAAITIHFPGRVRRRPSA